MSGSDSSDRNTLIPHETAYKMLVWVLGFQTQYNEPIYSSYPFKIKVEVSELKKSDV